MKISGKAVAEEILKLLKEKIEKENLKPSLAIILAGDNPPSRVYVNNKIKTSQQYGIDAQVFEFGKNDFQKVLNTIKKLNNDPKISGMIVQYPVYEGWNFEKILESIDPKKDVDGFLEDSPFTPATAAGVWEMLAKFAEVEGFKDTKDFLSGKRLVILGKGKTAGSPTRKLLEKKGFGVQVIDSKTENPDEIIKNADVVISATGRKNIINGSNIKNEVYVIGVGVGKEIIDGEPKIYGDINEQEVSQKAKLYCPTIGGIGPLTIACLLKNVVESASLSSE